MYTATDSNVNVFKDSRLLYACMDRAHVKVESGGQMYYIVQYSKSQVNMHQSEVLMKQ